MNEVELGWPAFYWVATLGACSGFFSVFITKRWSDRDQLRAAGNAIVAHLMEFRLFPEEPVLVLSAQRDLIAANGRLLRVLLIPMMLTALPMALMLWIADGFFGHAALRVGLPAVVTAHIHGTMPDLDFVPSNNFVLETQAVRAINANEMSWRIRPERETSGDVQLISHSQVLHQPISSANGIVWTSEQFPWFPRTWFDHATNVVRVQIQYPGARVLGHHWVVWFSLAACAGAAIAAQQK